MAVKAINKRILKSTTVDVPVLGGSINVKEISGLEKAKYQDKIRALDLETSEGQYTAILILLSITMVADNGKPVITPYTTDVLDSYSLEELQPVVEAASDLNGMNDKEVKN